MNLAMVKDPRQLGETPSRIVAVGNRVLGIPYSSKKLVFETISRPNTS